MKKRPWEEVWDDMQKTSAQQLADFGGRGIVVESSELERVRNLPRRVLDLENIYDCTDHFRKEGGTMELYPLQNACLVEACLADGLVGMLAVGAGKTLVTLLIGSAMSSRMAVLLVPSQLKEQLNREIDELYGKHFNIPMDQIKIISYNELSSVRFATVLELINPDLIVLDEAQHLSRKSTRQDRFFAFMDDHPACRLVALSGTMTQRSIKDYARIMEYALRKNSPLPGAAAGRGTLLDWASVLDAGVPDHSRKRPGALKKFCAKGETVREGFRRRLIQTQGVVASGEDELGVSLVVCRKDLDIPALLQKQMDTTQEDWTIGDEEFEDHLALARTMRQLAQGFYYRWAWPNDVKDTEWLEARSAWHKEIRQHLTYNSRPGADSAKLYTNAVLCGAIDSPSYAAWAKVMNRPEPPTVAVWLDQFVIDYAIEWAKKSVKKAPSIIWYTHKCVGEWLAQKSGFAHYGAGKDASTAKEPVIICSIASQGTGKNLQHVYSRSLVLDLPPNGKVVEQLFGRTHRNGQKADGVLYDWLGHTPELIAGLAQAIIDAEYVVESTGQRQKLLYCDMI